MLLITFFFFGSIAKKYNKKISRVSSHSIMCNMTEQPNSSFFFNMTYVTATIISHISSNELTLERESTLTNS